MTGRSLDIAELVRKELKEKADLEFQAFASPILRAVKPVLGVRLPILHKMAQNLLKMDFRPFLEHSEDRFYEETMLRGLVIAQARWPEQERLKRLAEFAGRIEDWSVCDSVAAALKSLKKERDFYFPFLKGLALGKGEFQIRFGLVCLMDHYLAEDWLKKVLSIAATADTEAYYARMGAAWLYTTAYTKFPPATACFFKYAKIGHEVAALTLRKIRESKAVSKEGKLLAQDALGLS